MNRYWLLPSTGWAVSVLLLPACLLVGWLVVVAAGCNCAHEDQSTYFPRPSTNQSSSPPPPSPPQCGWWRGGERVYVDPLQARSLKPASRTHTKELPLLSRVSVCMCVCGYLSVRQLQKAQW